MSFRMLLTVLFFMSLAIGAMAKAACACPPPMTGDTKIAVEYVPGPNVAQFGEYVDGHLAFLAAQMQAGTIQYAGPFFAKDQSLAGGIAIYNTTDFAAVEKLTAQDPVIQKNVFTPVIRSWMECSVPKN
ncbi:MAG: YciI family protein [Bdellovibrionota bacterium]